MLNATKRSSIDSQCWLLSGPSIPAERLEWMKQENLKNVLQLTTLQDRDGHPCQILHVKRKLYTGHYSDVYLLTVVCGPERRQKKLTVKVINREWCPKRSNYENELLVCRMVRANPHPNLVPLIAIRQFDHQSFFALFMRYGGRFNLERFRTDCFTRKRIPESMAIYLFRQLCEAMAHLHGLNIVHRDLKPDNILVIPSPAAGGGRRFYYPIHFRIWLIDFGFAKLVDPHPSIAGEPKQAICSSHKGTLEYMAPELLENRFFYDAFRTDIYAAGVLLYKMLYGISPFRVPAGGSRSFSDTLQEYRRVKSQPIAFPELENEDEKELVKDGGGNDAMAAAETTRRHIEQMLHREPEQRPANFLKILQSDLF